MSDAPHTLPSPLLFIECQLHPVSTEGCMDALVGAAARGERLRVSYLNAHCSNLAADDAVYRDILNGCDLVYADGQAVVWASRWLGGGVPERVNAGDFILEFCRACAERGVRLFLLGGREGETARAGEAWRTAVAGLEIAGMHHGFFSDEEAGGVAELIRDSGADVVLVGMGAPRQELWMQQWGDTSRASVVWCVGALFEYYGGGRARAPRWMRRVGLEWFFRLCLEPRRLAKRYLFGNLRFVWRVLRTGR